MEKDLTTIGSSFIVSTVEGEKGIKPQPAVSGCQESTPGQEANVVKADVMTSNGVIHVIDSVILPK